MYIPIKEVEERKTLRRYGNDYGRMPAFMREFYRLTLKQRHNVLVSHTGKCWDLPIDGAHPCPLCNTGCKPDSRLTLFSFNDLTLGTKSKSVLVNGAKYD